ncbi:MAG: DUF502 domain-containing protein [Gammaproteobacteria bacterium]
MFAMIRRYFISGLLVWIPIWVTLLVIHFIVTALNTLYVLLPKRFQIDTYLGFHVPGVGIVVTLLIIFATGIFAANFLGKRLVKLWDMLVSRIPVISVIYSGAKQVLDTIFSPKGQAFRKVMLIEYPRQGLWSIAFQTGTGGKELNEKIADGEEVVTVFVPTTPNPTSGFLIMVPVSEAYELDMTVDQALKFVISLGVVQPMSRAAAKKLVATESDAKKSDGV